MSPAMCWVGGGPAAPEGEPFVGCGGRSRPCREVGGTPLGGAAARLPMPRMPLCRLSASQMCRDAARSLLICSVWLLAIVASAVTGLAHASPADPTWIPGLYDDGDYDDVILALLSIDGLVIEPIIAITTEDVVRPLDARPLLLTCSPHPEIGHNRSPPLAGQESSLRG